MPGGGQAHFLTVNPVIRILEQLVDRYRFLGEIRDATIVGPELRRDRGERHIVAQLLIDLQR